MTRIKKVELQLKGKSYQELEKDMSTLSTGILLQLLNGKSRKIGDTASSLLNRRRQQDQLAMAILAGKYTTIDGKLRAANTICFGKIGNQIIEEALLYMVQDKAGKIVDSALFALVVLRRNNVIPMLKKILDSKISQKCKDKIELAIKGLEANDPKIYFPNYGE